MTVISTSGDVISLRQGANLVANQSNNVVSWCSTFLTAEENITGSMTPAQSSGTSIEIVGWMGSVIESCTTLSGTFAGL